MDMTAEFYRVLAGYTGSVWWMGLLFTAALGLCAYLAFGPAKRQAPLKLWMAAALLWTAWVWMVGVTWTHNLGLLGQEPMLWVPVIMEPLWALALTGVAAWLGWDARQGRRLQLALPDPLWERVVVGALLFVAAAFPLWTALFGRAFPETSFVGTHHGPTFVVVTVLLAAALPRAGRLPTTIMVVAVTAAWGSIFGGGQLENVILLPVSFWAGYRLVRHWQGARSLRLQRA